MTTDLSSIHELLPIEIGGIVARKGFSFQDHVAVSFLLDMYENEELEQVWCETQDDVTLIKKKGSGECVEFIQAKSNELNHLWSVAELCKRSKKGSDGTKNISASILERSLQYDRCKEPCCFRVITTIGPNKELSILKLSRNSPERERNSEKFDTLKQKIREKLPEAKSQKGNTTDYWVANTKWDARHDLYSVRNDNLLCIRKISENIGEYIASDQIEELYAKLLAKAVAAAMADWDEGADKKKICRGEFISWLIQLIQKAAHPGQEKAGTNLTKKMEWAGLQHEIETAARLRRRYRESILQPRYMSSPERSVVEGEIESGLHKLRSNLDAQIIKDDGPSFHSRCLKEVSDIRSRLEKYRYTKNVPPEHLMVGFMYNLTDRCPHRFTKAST